MENTGRTSRNKVDFTETEIKFGISVLNEIRDVYNFFAFLKKERGLNFSIILLNSQTLKDTILKNKRETDFYTELKTPGMNLIISPETNYEGSDRFIKRLIKDVSDVSGDFASVVEVKSETSLETALFTLLLDYMNLLKQSKEWRTAQITFKEV